MKMNMAATNPVAVVCVNCERTPVGRQGPMRSSSRSTPTTSASSPQPIHGWRPSDWRRWTWPTGWRTRPSGITSKPSRTSRVRPLLRNDGGL